MPLATPTLSVSILGATSARLTIGNLDAMTAEVEIERSASGGGYAQIDVLYGFPSSYDDTGIVDGTVYLWRIRIKDGDGNYSSYSTATGGTTPLPAATGLSPTGAPTSVLLTWVRNAQNNTGVKIYRTAAGGSTFSLIYTGTDPSEVSYSDTGLSAGQWYIYYVETYNAATSTDSAESVVFTSDPPNAPSLLALVALGTTSLRASWRDNADNETGFTIEWGTDGITFGDSATVGADVTTYDITSLSSNTLYYVRVKATNSSGSSGYCATANCSTMAAIAQPTGLTVTPWGNETLEIVFQDNSTGEDHHCIEQSDTGAGGWSEIVQLAPNQCFYRVTGLGDGATKYFRVRALQHGTPDAYSSYSSTVSGTTLSAPSAPADLAVSEYQDTWARLTWTSPGTEAVIYVYQSPDDAVYTLIATLDKGVEYYKASGLTAGTLYYWKLKAGTAAGDSALTAAVSQTTRSAYEPSAFERLIMRPKARIIHLVEVNPLMVLSGWALSGGCTYAYEKVLGWENGAEFDAVYENGTALTEKTSIATVEATAGTWWFDTATRTLYVHASGGDDPINYTLTGSFWLYYTTWQRGATVYNGHNYLPLVPADGVPGVSATAKAYWEGSFELSVGAVQLVNRKSVKSGWMFDKAFANYVWVNRPVKVLAGGDGFTYSQFYPWAAGLITDDYSLTDSRLTLPLRDIRNALASLELPLQKYDIATFPNMDENLQDKPRPFGFGSITGAVANCIDTTSRHFEFHAGRIKSVEYVYQNGTALTGGTDYYIDYQRGRITLADTLTWATSDIITVDFTGAVNDADSAVEHGAEIFLYAARNLAGLTLSQLDLDSIYETAGNATTDLALYIYKGKPYAEFVRLLEHSVRAYSYQDGQGRLGLRWGQTAAASSIRYVPEAHVFEFGMQGGVDSRYKYVHIHYNEDPSTERYQYRRIEISTADWVYGAKGTLEIYTALKTSSAADTLGAAVVALLNRETITLAVSRTLYTVELGDLIYLTRERYYSTAGTANNKLLRVIGITKDAGDRVSITAEEV